MATTIRKKLVIVGDSVCEKTVLLYTFVKHEFPEKYIPMTFENHISEIEVDGKVVELALWDTTGSENFERLRPLTYPDTDVILMCFSVSCQDSLENIPLKWLPEVKHYCPGVPFLLVGTNRDLRTNTDVVCVHPMEGKLMATKIGAVIYMECSAKLQEGVREIFVSAAQASLNISK